MYCDVLLMLYFDELDMEGFRVNNHLRLLDVTI